MLAGYDPLTGEEYDVIWVESGRKRADEEPLDIQTGFNYGGG
jgi:hypothetical protein